MHEAFVLGCVRSALGKAGGQLAALRPDDLAAAVIGEVLRRQGINGGDVDDVVLGCANQAGEDSRNVARIAALLAGLPDTVPGVTVNRLCASGLEAVVQASRAVSCDEGELIVAGGVESMSRSPWVLPKPERPYPRGAVTVEDSALGWRFVNPQMPVEYLDSLGQTAENVAERYGVSRAEQDRWALRSHRRALAAHEAGRLKEEIVELRVPNRRGDPAVVGADEGPRPETDLDRLSRLRPAFTEGGTVTAGNSSPLSDGAAALLVGSAAAASRHGLPRIARIIASASVGVHPAYMGIGPVPAIRAAIDRAGIRLDQVDLIEINEAFASQVLACIAELGLDEEKVNVNGGAIALGHPLGCSGARLLGSLALELRRRGARYGIASLCVGVGQGLACVIENPEVS